jgi:hypothetical protein
MKKIRILTFFALCVIAWSACSDEQKKSNTETTTDTTAVTKSELDSSSSCAKPILTVDPNNTKPMALMMRQMVVNMDKMKSKLENGERVQAKDFPFLRFYLVEPTDPNVLEPQFYENARLFQAAYQQIFETKALQVTAYNAAIGKCINCHQSYCSGPIKRIKKLLVH